MKHVNIKIFGEVQGVGFRDATYWKARKSQIAGFVMNEPDGSVYVEAEGDEDTLKEFVAWCAKGPFPARVERIKTEWTEPGGKFTGFRIG
jgi:acylphosphatase